MRLWKFGARAAAPRLLGTAWWADANQAALAPAPDIIARLRAEAATAEDPDERERADEMIEGLARLQELAAHPALPALATQHRVIGADVCHFTTPASLAGQHDTPGKLFVTSARLVFAGPRVQAWPWHRITRVVRRERELLVAMTGAADPPVILCNSYGDALVVAYFAARLIA